MKSSDIAASIRSRASDSSRRDLLAWVTGGLLGMLAPLTSEPSSARKKRSRKPRERKTTAAPPACAASCPGTCALCVDGPGSPTQCAARVNIFCNVGCGSDDDCLDSRPDFPHCVSRWVDRGTGQITDAAHECAGIAPYSPAYCSQIDACA